MARVVVTKAMAGDPRAEAKVSMNPRMHTITGAAARAKEKGVVVKVAKEKEKDSKVTKESKEKEAFILQLPCSQLRLPNLQPQMPKKKKKLHRHSKERQKAQVVAVNVVLGGILVKVAPH